MKEPGLVRALGVVEASAIVVGTIVGTGIFLKPRILAELLDSPGLILAVWVAGGILSFLGALSYAELGALFPEAGGEYLFMRETYGPFSGFLWAWTYFVCAKIGSIAALGAGFAIYLKAFVPLPGHLEPLAGGVAVLGVTLVNVLGVATGGRFQASLTVLKVASISGLIVLAFLAPQGSFAHLEPLLPTRRPGLASSTGLALVSVLWAYDGWNDLVMVSGEIKDPGRNVFRATLYGMSTVVVLYLLTNLAYHYALGLPAMARSERVAEAAVAGVLGPRVAAVLSGVILVSILGALNGSILSGARIPYAAARDGLAPQFLGHVHASFRTPVAALLVQGVLACTLMGIFTLFGIGQFDKITDMVIFAEWAFYLLCCAAVILLRIRIPDAPRPYRAWGYPYSQIVFVLSAAALVVNSLVAAPRQSLMGLALISLGAPVYLLLGRSTSRRI